MLCSPEGCSRALGFRALAALLVVGLCACGGGDEPGAPPSTSGCPQLDPQELVTLDAEVRVIANGQSPQPEVSPLAPALITDGGDVYWYDGLGSVFVERKDEARVVELLRSDESESPQWHPAVFGIAASVDRLFVGNGFSSGFEYASLSVGLPGRLLSISKQNGLVEVLLELSDRTIVPIAADSERVVVFVTGGPAGFYQVRLADPQLERLPLAAPFESSQLIGGMVYWLNGEHPPLLLRSGFDDAEPESVMRMYQDDSFFAVGPHSILSREDRILPGYYYVGKDFVLSDDAGCRAFPGAGRGYVLDAALDTRYAYWYGARQPSQSTLPLEVLGLVRVDVESGASNRLNTPGFTPGPDVRILAQDDTRLFLGSNGTVVVVQKP
jgi:hypothetical protein